MSNPYVEHFIKLWLESVSEPQSFAVNEETWERFQSCYQDNAQGFFVCETNDGRYIGINLAYVEMAHFLWQSPPIQWDKEEPHLWVELHIINSKGGSFGVDESKELADIFWYLELGDKDEILSFTDIDGEEVMFTPKRLVWIEASAEFVKEGFDELNDEMVPSNS